MKRREEKRREEKSITLLTNILSFKLLIALLSILLFLISCKSNENPNTPKKPPRKKHELEGTWIGYDNKDKDYELKFTVDSDGNIIFYPKPAPSDDGSLYRYRYTAKVETNSIVYPYKIKISNNILIESGWLDGGAFEFKNSSNCAVNYDRINHNRANGFDTTGVTVEFTKQ